MQSIVNILPPDYLDINEPHINDIIMRYKTLDETNQDLMDIVQRNSDEIETNQAILTSLIKVGIKKITNNVGFFVGKERFNTSI